MLGFPFDGVHKTLWLEEPQQDTIVTVLKGWLGTSKWARAGVPLQEFHSTMAKVRHTFIAILAGKGLLSPYNTVIPTQTSTVYIHHNKASGLPSRTSNLS